MYKYSVLMAIPNRRRGERVNIGVVILRPDRLDIRAPAWEKLRGLSAGPWDVYVPDAIKRLSDEFRPGKDLSEIAARFAMLEPLIRLSDVGWFLADTDDQYEVHANGILAELVVRTGTDVPDTLEKTPKATRINAEIAKDLSGLKILAKPSQTIDEHLVKRGFFVSETEGLRADFAVKNGVYHITSTLDLRHDTVHIKEAAWKAMVLSEAPRNLGPGTQRLGVYAASCEVSQFRPHIQLLKTHSDQIYNWSNPQERWAYRDAMRAAVGRSYPQGSGLAFPTS